MRAGIVVAVSLAMLAGASSALAKPTITGAGATAPQLLYEQWAYNYRAPRRSTTAASVRVPAHADHQRHRELRGQRQAADACRAECFAGTGPVPLVHRGHRGDREHQQDHRRPAQADGRRPRQIYEGKITNWNNWRIKALNPGLKSCRRSTS